MTLEFQKYVPQSIGVARLLSKKDAADFVSFYLRGRPADLSAPDARERDDAGAARWASRRSSTASRSNCRA